MIPDVSIIIPTRNGETRLPRLLTILKTLGGSNTEIVVVSETESTVAEQRLLRPNQDSWLTLEGNRGERLKQGAEAARGTFLWFLFADAQPHKDSLRSLVECLNQNKPGGFFRFVLGGERTLAKRVIEWGVSVRCAMGGTPYGDQGLFLRRKTYFELGGHNPWPLFEEVHLLKAIKNLGVLECLDLPMLVDARRWDQEGYFLRTLKNRLLALGFIYGIKPERLAGWYARGR